LTNGQETVHEPINVDKKKKPEKRRWEVGSAQINFLVNVLRDRFVWAWKSIMIRLPTTRNYLIEEKVHKVI